MDRETKKTRAAGISDADVTALEQQSKMTELVEKLKEHGGPLNNEEEIDQFLSREREMKTPEKKIATKLNAEIRFRRDANLRFALTKQCYLYKQQKISNEERVRDLKILVSRPDKRSSATLDDLRDVYLFNDDGDDMITD